MSRLRIDCREADRLLSLRKDAHLGCGQRLALWWHLCFCNACRTVRRNLDFLSAAARRLERPGGAAPDEAGRAAGTPADRCD